MLPGLINEVIVVGKSDGSDATGITVIFQHLSCVVDAIFCSKKFPYG